MSKIGNILAKGLVTGGHVVAGSVGFGLVAIGLHWTPPETWPQIAKAAWYGAGASVLGGLGASVIRWARFDPSKLGK